MTSYLLSLPNELLLSVFEHLVPEPLSTGSSPELSRDCIQRRGTLRHLCPVSKSLCDIAQPLLFRNLAVINGAQTVLLFRSLWNVPALRRCPRSFACPILLSEQDVVEDTLNCWNSNVGKLSRDPADPDTAHFLNSGYVQLRQVEAPLANGEVRPVTLRGAHPWLEFSSELPPEILIDWDEVLRHLDDEDPADNKTLKKDTMTKAMHQSEELRFYSSRMAPWSMRQLLSHCPNLRSLHWAFGDNVEWHIPTFPDRPFYESDFEPQASSETTLDKALVAASGHPESLHLDVMIKSTARFDSRYRVTCLSAFTSLRHLTIDTVCLLGLRPYAVDPLEKNLGLLHLIHVLPPNLEKLVLIEKWYGHQIRLQELGPDYVV
ncbi:hypothetical protein DL767_002134 [Monosporascus sp. MG133]|nr:hypothetical protein DL767_002134 [Monosporascus sp. MG133]